MTTRTITEPDEVLIKRLIDAGNIIPGAGLVRGPDSVRIGV
jgi:hypothetical protein